MTKQKILTLVLFVLALVIVVLYMGLNTQKQEHCVKYMIKNYDMYPALAPDYVVIVDTLASDITYGDILFYFPTEEEKEQARYYQVGRVVGMYGDVVGLEENIVTYRKQQVPHQHVRSLKVGMDGVNRDFEEFYEVLPNNDTIIILNGIVNAVRDNVNPIDVSKDNYYILGDCRADAYDSRFLGAIPAGRIIGKVVEIKKLPTF